MHCNVYAQNLAKMSVCIHVNEEGNLVFTVIKSLKMDISSATVQSGGHCMVSKHPTARNDHE